jgi:DNA-directed RNA polymerase specialized sigma24 family protein
MFRLYRADNWERAYAAPTATAVDGLDAQRVAKAVALLPEPHRLGLSWYYVRPTSPAKACRQLGTTMAGLAQFVRDGRQMLINRRI